MKTRPDIDHFMQRILSIEPAYGAFYGMAIPGNAGSSAGITGASNAGTDIIASLRSNSQKLVATVHQGDGDKAALSALAADIEGSLRTLAVLEQLSPERLDSLLGELDAVTA